MTDVEILRRAAGLMRERANAAAEPWHPWGDDDLPERSGMEAWQADMKGYLGGEWADHAASWDPTVALIVAGWLQACADDHDDTACPAMDHALEVAVAYLRDVTAQADQFVDSLDAEIAESLKDPEYRAAYEAAEERPARGSGGAREGGWRDRT